MKNNLSLDKKLLKSIIAVACFLAPAGAIISWLMRDHLPARFTQGFLAGTICGLANLYFLILLITSVVNSGGVRKAPALVGVLGINAAVFTMFLVIWKHWAGTMGLTAGFTVVLIVLLINSFSLILKANKS